jgi:hypothetical protein
MAFTIHVTVKLFPSFFYFFFIEFFYDLVHEDKILDYGTKLK